jgi:hypothetical protein
MRLKASIIAGSLAGVVVWGARADVTVTLRPFDASGAPISGPVPEGATVAVDILVSAGGNDAPLEDVRLFQFDFAATSPTIELGPLTWEVGTDAYGFQSVLSPPATVAGAASLLFASDPRLITLDTEPVLVATIEVTVHGGDTLDAVGATLTGQLSHAQIDAGFGPRRIFSPAEGNLNGGTVTFDVEGDSETDGGDDSDDDGIADDLDPDDDNDGTVDAEDDFPLDPGETTDTDGDAVGNNADPDDDGDGVDDGDDAFPHDPTETADSDGDGIGDNADPQPPRRRGLCGIAMLSTSLFIMWGLFVLRPRGRCRAREGVQ